MPTQLIPIIANICLLLLSVWFDLFLRRHFTLPSNFFLAALLGLVGEVSLLTLGIMVVFGYLLLAGPIISSELLFIGLTVVIVRFIRRRWLRSGWLSASGSILGGLIFFNLLADGQALGYYLRPLGVALFSSVIWGLTITGFAGFFARPETTRSRPLKF